MCVLRRGTRPPPPPSAAQTLERLDTQMRGPSSGKWAMVQLGSEPAATSSPPSC